MSNRPHVSSRGLDQHVADRIPAPAFLALACAREVPADGGADLSPAKALLEDIERCGEPHDGDLGVGNRAPVKSETLWLPENPREDQVRDALLPEARTEQPERLESDVLAEAIVRRFGVDVREPVQVEERVCDVPFREKLHRLEGDAGLSHSDGAGDEEHREGHCRTRRYRRASTDDTACHDSRMLDSPFEIRLASDDDRRPLATLFAAVAEERDGIATEPPVDVETWAARWRLEGTFVAVAGREIVGSLSVEASRFGYGEIGMAVAREWRRRGVGSALLAAAIAWARERGLHKLSLSVFPHNAAAIQLYRKHGFVEEGRRVKHFRRANGELWDAIEMGLLLDDVP